MLEIGQQPGGEVLRIVDRQARHAVERSFRPLQKNTGDGSQTFEQHIAAALIFGDDRLGVVVAEGVGADGDELREPGRRQSSLGHS